MDVTQLSVPNFPTDAEDVLKREAKRQDRSLASLLRTILLDYAAKLEPAPAPQSGGRAPETA